MNPSLHGEDLAALREIGRQLRDIAADPVNGERKSLWKRLNGLESVRPPVCIYEIPWPEMGCARELRPTCRDPFLAGLETTLRRTIYQWRNMPGDMVVEAFIPSPPAFSVTAWLPEPEIETSREGEPGGIVSKRFIPRIREERDLEEIGHPVVRHDEEESERRFLALAEIFEGILPVYRSGIRATSIAPWDQAVRLAGLEPLLSGMIDRPAFVHALIGRLFEGHLSILGQFERLGLLDLNNNDTHLGGGLQYTDELPAAGFIPGRVRPADMWGRTMSQAFSVVSPAMHEEFALEYELRYLRLFGLSYYGCCEPLHRKIGLLEKIPGLRKISMSPWVNVEEGAEAIGGKYVYSMKPNPAVLAAETWDPERARAQLLADLRKARRCPVEIVLKDISTVRGQPDRLREWARLARETAAAF